MARNVFSGLSPEPDQAEAQFPAFPSEFGQPFDAAALRHGVPVNILRAIAERESGYDAKARRGTARGLFGRDSSSYERTGINPYDVDRVLDAEAKSLRAMLDKGMSVGDALRSRYSGDEASASDVLARAKRIAETDYPLPPEPPAPNQQDVSGSARVPSAEEALRRSNPLIDVGRTGLGLAGDVVGGGVELLGGVITDAGNLLDTLPERFGRAFEDMLSDDAHSTDRYEARAPIESENTHREGSVVETLREAGRGVGAIGRSIAEGLSSEEDLQAVRNSQLSGNLFDPSTWDFGEDPSAIGYIKQGARLLGQMAPMLLAGRVGGVAGGAAAGGMGGAGMADQQGRDAIQEMYDEGRLAEESPLYRELLERSGGNEAAALKTTMDVAGDYAAGLTRIVSAGGGAATSKILSPATSVLAGQGPITRAIGRLAVSGAEEGAQEVAESAAAYTGVNEGTGTQIDPLKDSFGDFVMGKVAGVGGAVPAAARELRRPTAPGGSGDVRVDAVADHLNQATDVETGDTAPTTDTERAEMEARAAEIMQGRGRVAPVREPAPASMPEPAPEPAAPIESRNEPVAEPEPPAAVAEAAPPPHPAAPTHRFAAGDEIEISAPGLPKPLIGRVKEDGADDLTFTDQAGEDLTISREEIDAGDVTVRPHVPPGPPDRPVDLKPPAAPRRQRAPAPDSVEGIEARLGYLAEQAKEGGWTQRLTRERGHLRAKLAEIKGEPKSVDLAANEAATSPVNDRPEPTPAQIEAGNYAKGHIRIGGLDISIENPEGSTRSGTDKSGKPWATTMKSHYGYIRGTVGKDKDHIDVFVKPGTESLADDAPIFVVNQVASDTGLFDEHKVLLGFATPKEARAAYLENYAKGWKGLRSMRSLDLVGFKAWLADGDTKRAMPERSSAEKPAKQKPTASATIRTDDGHTLTVKLTAKGPWNFNETYPAPEGGARPVPEVVEQAEDLIQRFQMIALDEAEIAEDSADLAAGRKPKDRGRAKPPTPASLKAESAEIEKTRIALTARAREMFDARAVLDLAFEGGRRAEAEAPTARIPRPRREEGVRATDLPAAAPSAPKPAARAAAPARKAAKTAKPEAPYAVGDTITLNETIDYVDAGKPHKITHVDKRAIHVETAEGGGTSIGRVEMERKGYVVAKAEKTAKAKRKPAADKPMLSIAEQDGFAASVLQELAQNDEMFALPKTSARTIEGALKALAPDVRFIGDTIEAMDAQDRKAEQRLTYETAQGTRFNVYVDGDRIWLDISRSLPGQMGSRIYQALGDYAFNAKKVFIGDPDGLSADALTRRTEAMLSSALRHGTTDHIEPHDYQIRGDEKLGVPPLVWRHGDTVANIEALIAVSTASTFHAVPELANTRFDFDTGTFRTAEGAPLSDEVVDAFARRTRRDGTASLGSGTLKRAVFLRSLLRTPSGERSGLLEQVFRARGALLSPELKDIFYDGKGRGEAAPANPLSVKDAEAELRKGPLGKQIGHLIDNGILTVVKSIKADGGPAARSDSIRGVAMPDRRIYVVATPAGQIDQMRSTVLHEAFHAGVRPLLGEPVFQRALDRVEDIVSRAIDRVGKGEARPSDTFWTDVFSSVRSRYGDPAVHIEETAALALQKAELAPPGLKETFNRMMGAVKAWALRFFGAQIGDVTPHQLRALSVQAIKAGWKRKGGEKEKAAAWSGSIGLQLPKESQITRRPGQKLPGPDHVFKTDAENPGKPGDTPKFSLAEETDQAQAVPSDEEVRLTFREKLRAAGTQSMKHLLALMPLRPLLDEVASHIPAAKLYLRTKQEMDSTRDHWHHRTAVVSQRWLRFRKGNRSLNADLMDLMHETTDVQVDPTKPLATEYTDADRATLKRPSRGETDVAWLLADGRRQKHERQSAAYPQLVARFNALPKEARELYVEVRDLYTALADEQEAIIIANARKALDIELRSARSRHAGAMKKINESKLVGRERSEAVQNANDILNDALTRGAWSRRARITQIRKKLESNRLKGPYFPFSRFGDFWVSAVSKDGGQQYFSKFEKVKDQMLFIKQMERAGGYTITAGQTSDSEKTRTLVDPNFLADVVDLVTGSGMAKEIADTVIDQINQRYLETLPDASLRKRRIHRKGRAGYVADALRGFAHHMFHGGHQNARLRFTIDLEQHIADAKEQAKSITDLSERVRADGIVNEMVKRNQFVMNPSGHPLAHFLTSAGFIWRLAVSPSAAFVNTSQTITLGVPVLAAYYDKQTGGARAYGIDAAVAEITRATKNFLGSRGLWLGEKVGLQPEGSWDTNYKITSEERSAIQVAKNIGLIERTQSHDVASVAETGIEYSARRERIMAILSGPMHHTEVFNREVTFLAAYRLARKAGRDHSAAIDDALDLTWKAHFDYQNTSRPRFMQHDVAKVAFLFKNYQVNMLYRLVRDFRQAFGKDIDPADRREAKILLFGVTAAMATTAGVRGTWILGILLPTLWGMFFGGEGDDDQQVMRRELLKMLPSWVVGPFLDGVPGYFLGMDISERVGLADIWFRSSDRLLEGRDWYDDLITQMAGPVYGVGRDIAGGAWMVLEGRVWRGIETMSPKFVKDVMQSARFLIDGVKTYRGDDILEDVSPYQALVKALGFTPAELGERYKSNSAMRNKEQIIMERRKRIHTAYDEAIQNGASRDDVMAEIRKFNRDYPEYGITRDSIRQSIRSRRRARERNEGGVTINPKIERRIRSEAAPAIYD